VTKVTKGPDDPYAIPEPDEPQSQKLDALRYLQMIYRDPQLSTAVRMRAAGLALPFESPKLAVTAVVSEQDFATVLDRRLKRIEEIKAKAIEATPLIDGEKVDVPLPPRVPDRRFRRI
jgi:hypothetical protein